MKDSLLELSNSALIQNILKKAGINPPPVLTRASAPWGERILRDTDVIIGGDGNLQSGLARSLVSIGASLILAPSVAAERFANIDHYQLQALDNSSMVSKAKAVLYDGSSIKYVNDLKDAYEFFHNITQFISPNTRVVILSKVPTMCDDPEEATVAQALIGFGKSLSKELGNKGSTVQIVQAPLDEEGGKRAAPLVQFLLSDYSAFITGQVLEVSTLAKENDSYLLGGSLAGKSVLVTGATGGIGKSTVLALFEEGAHVLCLDHEDNREALEDLAKKVDGTAIPMSLGLPDNGVKLEAEIKQAVGYVDVLIHNAGVTRDKTLKRMVEVHWDQVLAVNLGSIIQITDHLCKTELFRDHGRVICLSSISGLAGNFGQTNYATAKAGLVGYVKALSETLAPRGITANAVAPGFIETPMTERMPFLTRQFARRLSTLSQGGVPNDVANAICFLASQASQGVNGAVLRVCGGHMMGA
ncbi:3-oxoacyl-ACP reductase [Pseudobacteriovorax antillogorgiicola]|uniref:3-oxoacyl-[acyl-carrier protein] reductase n=1 Tax=Pseudobacteriovorax antillogorgiicola TaxID=1513793 RepID=A0A1Y6CE56_9BACT|nr:3-oxoacyl-ACP reductase [Pseudobacteriovorax antillogorgiicola]TCS51728.1 3-oxoacyl-[acyl-carrier protein] reductase [Pseudobacteriovorax antillogorgiicola]SMF49494.1 3-oxoacyl-[acyl-carrier protein] reductase [Pseudobacteriovorax antillogorgiicola]